MSSNCTAQPLHLASSVTLAHPRAPRRHPRPSAWWHLAHPLSFLPKTLGLPLRSGPLSVPALGTHPSPNLTFLLSILTAHPYTTVFSAHREEESMCGLSVCGSVCVCVLGALPQSCGDPKLQLWKWVTFGYLATHPLKPLTQFFSNMHSGGVFPSHVSLHNRATCPARPGPGPACTHLP